MTCYATTQCAYDTLFLTLVYCERAHQHHHHHHHRFFGFYDLLLALRCTSLDFHSHSHVVTVRPQHYMTCETVVTVRPQRDMTCAGVPLQALGR